MNNHLLNGFLDGIEKYAGPRAAYRYLYNANKNRLAIGQPPIRGIPYLKTFFGHIKDQMALGDYLRSQKKELLKNYIKNRRRGL